MKRIGLVAMLATLLWTTAWCEPVVISGDHEDRFIQGQGRDFRIEGHHNDVVITGRAGRVTVDGHHNDVVIEEPASLDVQGHHNDIVFKRGNPKVTKGGDHNTIVAADGSTTIYGYIETLDTFTSDNNQTVTVYLDLVYLS